MQLSNAPGKLLLPFANAGAKNTIPTASQIGITAGAASLTDGFPPLTRTPIAAGGVPPSGLDMNGILYALSAALRWAAAGGGYVFDNAFASDSNVNGYPKGARVLRSDGVGYWLNTVENNTTDPEGGSAAGWVPDLTNGVATIAMTNANVTLTALQYGKPLIVISGALSANLNLIFPAIAGEWTVANNTTGAFTITCKTAAGTGVAVSGGCATVLYGDGTNIYSADNDVAKLFNQRIASATGTVDAITATITPAPRTWEAGVPYFIRAAGANATTTPTFTPNSGTLAAKTIVKGNNLPLVAGDISGAGHWLMMQYDATLDKVVLLNPAYSIQATNNFRKNLIVDGACRLAQLAAKTLTTSAQYGAVDMFAAWGTGTAVSAGSIAQNTAAPVGQEGYSLHLSGVTITGTGVVYARHRIESAVAKALKNKTASFSVQVYHDVGSSINYTAIIRKANAVDNFTGVTVISTGSATPTPNAAGTLLKFENVAMGDCSNGIEIEVQAACGAVAGKNFHFTEWRLEPGTAATAFEWVPINDNIAAVERYLEKTYDLGVLPGTVTFTGSIVFDSSGTSDGTCMFRSRKRTAPTMTYYSALSGASGTVCYQNTMSATPQGDTPVSNSRIGTNGVSVETNPGDNYMPIIHFVADARL